MEGDKSPVLQLESIYQFGCSCGGKIPGGVRAFLYTSKGGETTTITEEQWMGVQVAGVLRYAEYGRRGERGLRMMGMNVREELIEDECKQ